ncbi:alpha/beta hydrolase [Streptomyces sp.]|uniref:alpha/beta hydrolase n=1 Tax=Streptomyces sp. TaxID=1931 RepID=UPI002F41DF16
MITPIGFTSDGAVLRGALYTPESARPAAGYPLVLLAQGLGTLHEWVRETAAVFNEAGIACIAADYRGFGVSDGEPRQQADAWRIVHDLRAAIDYVHTLDGIDTSRIGVWGTSFGGGPAMVTAAVDRRVKVLALQVPVASGSGLMKQLTTPEVLAGLRTALEADRVGIVSGQPLVRMIQTSIDPADQALASDEGTYSWMTEEAKATPHWVNQLTFQTIDRLMEFEPADYLPRFAPRPVLLIVEENDEINPEQYAIDALEKVEGPKKLVRLNGGNHYSVYREHFDKVSSEARDWFVTHLVEAEAAS